jgi:threonine dehydratase
MTMWDDAHADITLQTIRLAASRITEVAIESPLRPSRHLSRMLNGDVRLKIETMQPTGSFKVRGAGNAMLSVAEAGLLKGVVTASTGNHGRAVAYVATSLGVEAVACLSDSVSAERAESIASEGATIVRGVPDQTEAIELARQIADERGYVFIPPFDDLDVIAGQGTIGLELREQMPELDAILVPVSGGGLAAGVGLAIKSTGPATRVIGVSSETTPAMKMSLDAGRPLFVPERPSLAESLMGDLGRDNQHSFRLTQRFLDEVVLVTEEQIDAAIRWALSTEHLVIEGAAAAVIAYLLTKPQGLREMSTAAVVTGDNVRHESLIAASSAL